MYEGLRSPRIDSLTLDFSRWRLLVDLSAGRSYSDSLRVRGVADLNKVSRVPLIVGSSLTIQLARILWYISDKCE